MLVASDDASLVLKGAGARLFASTRKNGPRSVILSFILSMSAACLCTLPALLFPVGGKKWVSSLKCLLMFHAANAIGIFSIVTFVSGSVIIGLIITLFIVYGISIASAIKYRILREPVYFTDIISLGALLRNPEFFIFSIPIVGWLCIAALLSLVVVAACHFVTASLNVRLYCIPVFSLVLAFYALCLKRASLQTPDWRRDIGRFGVLGMLVIYWVCWKSQPDPDCVEIDPGKPKVEVVLVVQCESFADPSIFEGVNRDIVPNLTMARASAHTYGDLLVSGFGAYTMRTEYGVLFGRDEAQLGFRQYDPFLTAQREASYALPARLKEAGYRTLFIHPHGLQFYRRDRLMPAIGFDVVDDCAALRESASSEKYVSDTDLADTLLQKIDNEKSPVFIYAVTMENHGPWAGRPQEALDTYLRHIRSSDQMLGKLVSGLEERQRSSLIVFFGDHRPSIQGIAYRDRERSTPFVVLQSEKGESVKTSLTPAELHHLIGNLAVTHREGV